MNDINQTPTDAAEQATMQDIERKYFAPENLEDGNDYVNHAIALCEAENVEPVLNFDPSDSFPDGYGLAVVPITKRVPEKGNVIVNVSIAAVPSFAAVAADEAGQSYIEKLVTDSLLRQIAAASKVKEDGQLTTIPYKIADFVTTTRTSGLAAFNEVASTFVAVLKKRGLKFINKALLRQVLSSASFAESQYPALAQSSWELVLKVMISQVHKKGIDAGVLQHWLDTRDQNEIDTTEIDLSDLADMM